MHTIKLLLGVFIIGITLFGCNNHDIDGDLPLRHVSPYFFNSENTFRVLVEKEGASKLVSYSGHFTPSSNTEFSKFYLKKHPEQFSDFFNVTVNLNANNTLTIEGVEHFEHELILALKEYIDFASEGKTGLIHLNFDERLALKHYVRLVNLIKPIESDAIKINTNIFIYNKEALPDCNCTL